MKTIIFLLTIFAVVELVGAQEVRTEVQNPATPYDSIANKDSVPSVYSVNGQFERIMVIRLKNKTDLLIGIEKAIKENNVKNAVILSGIGSVVSYHYHVVGNAGFPIKNIFVKNDSGPTDIASMNGYVVNGRVHIHATFSNSEKSFGGHVEQGTNVFTFAIVTVGVFSDAVDLNRVDDWNYR